MEYSNYRVRVFDDYVDIMIVINIRFDFLGFFLKQMHNE